MKMRNLRSISALTLFLSLLPANARSSERDQPQASSPSPDEREAGDERYEFRSNHDPNGIGKFYMGREIAMVMGHQGIDWLERPEREEEEAPATLVQSLGIKKGMVVADIGAGSGYFSFRLAGLVGDEGRVLAVDIQPEMIAELKQRMREKKVANVTPVLGTITDPKLPEESVDLILMVDVYHEFSHPYEMATAMVKSLKPGGRLVFVEYRREDPSVPIKLVHKMSEKQVLLEMKPHPLRWVGTVSTLPRQHIIIFEKIAAKEAEGELKK
ncbi:MAG: class I SAM-dependent methyltransferase [Planctomycetota bacterium]